MKQLIINIKDNKYTFFLELLKSMDFVSIADNEDWYENLSANDKKSIQKGIEDLENGRIPRSRANPFPRSRANPFAWF